MGVRVKQYAILKGGTQMRKIMRCLVITGLVLVSMVCTVSAKEGFYLGGQIPYNIIGGDFDDKTMPKVNDGAGIGLIAGYTFPIKLAVEIDWSGSSHKSAGSNIGFGEFSLNVKYSFMMAKVQPYLFAGIGSFAIGDSSLMLGGTGYNLGIGADYYATPNVSIGGGLFRKFITYDQIVSGGSGVTLSENIKGDTTSIRFDVTYHF